MASMRSRPQQVSHSRMAKATALWTSDFMISLAGLVAICFPHKSTHPTPSPTPCTGAHHFVALSGLPIEGEGKELIYDIGRGTFHNSNVTVEDGIFDVKATAGEAKLGERDVDQRNSDVCTGCVDLCPPTKFRGSLCLPSLATHCGREGYAHLRQ